MRLYHSRLFPLIAVLLLVFLAGCTQARAGQSQITVQVAAGGKNIAVQVSPGSTVQQALNAANLTLGSLDRVEPPPHTLLSAGTAVRLIHVTEKFEVEQVVIPFEHKTLRNESLPKDQEVLLQSGKNGLRENTYRRVYEDGIEITSPDFPFKSTIVQTPVEEIMMTGVQAPFVPMAIPGRLVYLRDGSAWIIEETTGNRRAVVTTGDLDGYIFSLSSDGAWLLFTRRSEEEGQINRLWAAVVDGEADQLVDLEVDNVIYFADWLPGSSSQVAYSTVEPQVAAPGWRTNNDLHLLTIFKSQRVNQSEVQLLESLGGVYPWWGISFAWAAGELRLAYTNDHSVGVLDFTLSSNVLKEERPVPGLEFPPLQTHASWAWVPGTAWGPDGRFLYTVIHAAPPGTSLPEESQIFDLAAVPVEGGAPVALVSQVGMFAYPIVSPLQPKPSGEAAYQVAYLQAAFPAQSETSRYRLMVMDRDGSNRQALFPPEDTPGLTPQRDWGVWSPEGMPVSGHSAIALIYQGNLWIVDAATGEAQQITGDNLTSRVGWKSVP